MICSTLQKPVVAIKDWYVSSMRCGLLFVPFAFLCAEMYSVWLLAQVRQTQFTVGLQSSKESGFAHCKGHDPFIPAGRCMAISSQALCPTTGASPATSKTCPRCARQLLPTHYTAALPVQV